MVNYNWQQATVKISGNIQRLALMNDREPRLRGNHGRQPPDWDPAIGAPFLVGGLAGFVEQLPGERAAPLPSGAFRPGKEPLAAGVERQGRMFALVAAPWWALGFREFRSSRFDEGKEDLPVGIPGAGHAVGALHEGHAAHRSAWHLPLVDEGAFEARSLLGR